jgi:hypothetical protein
MFYLILKGFLLAIAGVIWNPNPRGERGYFSMCFALGGKAMA